MLNPRGSGSLVIERDLEEGATVGSLLADLALGHPNFRAALFNPDAGTVSDQVVVVLNDSLLQCPDVTTVKLNDGDKVMLLPQFAGG